MSTLSRAIRTGDLLLHAVSEWDRRVALRELYVVADFWDRIDSRPDFIEEDEDSRRSPAEQVEIMLNDFRCGNPPPGADELKRLEPTRHGVWRLHPPGVRVFGWVPEPDIFVAVSAELKRLLSPRAKYRPYLQGVIDFRRSIGMDQTYVASDFRAVYKS